MDIEALRPSIRCPHCNEVLPPDMAMRLRSTISDRQKQVMDCLARGMCAEEIAEQLQVTRRTVKVHLGRIYQKFDLDLAHGNKRILIATVLYRNQLWEDWNNPNGVMRREVLSQIDSAASSNWSIKDYLTRTLPSKSERPATK